MPCVEISPHYPRSVGSSAGVITTFALISSAADLFRGAVAKVLPPIVVNGVRYRVLRLEGEEHGPKFLLRNDDGDLFETDEGGLVAGSG